MTPHRLRVLFSALALLAGAASCGDDKTDSDQPINPGPGPGPEETPAVTISVGELTNTSIEVLLSAEHADDIAFYCVKEADGEEGEDVTAPDAAAVYAEGRVVEATAEPASYTISDLEEGVPYAIYAAARKGDAMSDVEKVSATTPVTPAILEVGSTSKTGFSYQLNVGPDDVYFHTYLEGWFFEYSMMTAMAAEGPEFDYNAFVWNLLVDYGMADYGPKTIEWQAGDEHEKLGYAALVPGKKYYVLAALYDEAAGAWVGVPNVIDLDMPAPGTSAEKITLSADEVDYDRVVLRMECDETKIAFFRYDLYSKESYDKFIEENGGVRGMMDYVAEYGPDVRVNTYTDSWGVDAGRSYMLCVYGIDVNGDELYAEMQVDVPERQPEIFLDLKPYNRELQGYYDYNTFLVTFAPMNFTDLNVDQVFCSAVPMERTTLESYLAMLPELGIEEPISSLEELEQRPEVLLQLNYMLYQQLMMPLYDDAELDSLEKNGYFDRVIGDLNPATEYVFMALAYSGETPVARIVTASTAAAPESGEASERYNEYLGNWTVLGQTTRDWSTYETYDVRIEELSPNRSYKVYGWGHSELAQEYPFEMRFDPQTGKTSVEIPQVLGQIQVEGKMVDLVFVGKIHASFSDILDVVDGFSGKAYRGDLRDDHLAMFGELLNIGGRTYEFMAMSYVARTEEGYMLLEGEEYDLVYRSVDRATSASASAVLPAARRLKSASVVCRSFEPAAALMISAPAHFETAGGSLAERFASDPVGQAAWLRSLPLRGVARLAK